MDEETAQEAPPPTGAAEQSSNLLYAYCVSDGATAAMLAGVQGLGGATLRVLESEGLCAVISEFGEALVRVTRENVFAHERVVAHLLRQTTPLPFRFGTLTSAKRLESYITAHRKTLRESLRRVGGAVEMSVKILLPEPEGEGGSASPSGREEAESALEGAAAGEGTRFLLALRRELSGDEEARRRCGELGVWLKGVLTGLVRETVVELHPAQRLLAASHLVERGKLAAYRARMEEARSARPELRFLTSGPWPPYSFCNLNP